MWWFSDAANTRHLISDAGLFGMETFAVLGGIVIIIQWWRMLTAKSDDANRIIALWWSIIALVRISDISGTRS